MFYISSGLYCNCSEYDDKTCYVYKYQTQLVSGVQPTGQQWGGLLLTSELELCFAQRDIGHAHQTFNSPEPYFLVTAQVKSFPKDIVFYPPVTNQ